MQTRHSRSRFSLLSPPHAPHLCLSQHPIATRRQHYSFQNSLQAEDEYVRERKDMSAGEADSDFEPLPFLPAGWGFQDDDSIIFDDQQQVLQHDKDGPSPSQQQTLNGYSFPSSDPEDLDKMLAAELTKLSVEERDQILFDLHGVADDMEETPELIEQSLSRMDQCLTTMTEHDSEDLTIAYQEALAQSPSYVRDEAFRTRFLRTERFEPDEAAKRYCKFFGVKKQLFGSEFLTKEIRIHDLSAKEQAALRSGVFQLLPIKDHAGRTVLLHIDVLTGDSDITSMVSMHICYTMI